MKQWERFIWPLVWSVWSILMVLQIILSFFLYNQAGLPVLRHIGWIILAVSAVFGWMPIFALRSKGAPKGKSYIHTTVLVDSGIYAVVRHPQYLAGILLNLALIFITQHWSIAIIGVAAMVMNYGGTALNADQELIEKFGDDYKRYMQRVPRMNFLVGLIRLLRRRKRL